jgi:hypothetical protein
MGEDVGMIYAMEEAESSPFVSRDEVMRILTSAVQEGAAKEETIAARPHSPLSRRSGGAAGRGAGGEGRRPRTPR